MNTDLRPISLALYDVSCVALDAGRKVERYADGAVTGDVVLRVLERLVVVQDQIAAAVDLLDAAAVGEPKD
jgi:hypothetical protein